MVFLFARMPTAYLPDEDQGILFTQVINPKNILMKRKKNRWKPSWPSPVSVFPEGHKVTV